MIDFAAVLADVRYRDWRFIVGTDGDGRLGDGDRHYLQVVFDAPDAWRTMGAMQTGEYTQYQRGRKWWLSPHMTRSELVQTALMAVLAAVEHEAREDFRYKGVAIFGPHLDVEALRVLVQSGGCEHRAS